MKRLDQIYILEKGNSLISLQTGQNVVFKLLELCIVQCNFADVVVFGGFDHRCFLLHNNTEALFFKRLFSHAEVNDSGVREDGGLKDRVSELGGDEELELGIPVQLAISNHNLLLTADLDVGLGNDVDEGGVQLFADIL